MESPEKPKATNRLVAALGIIPLVAACGLLAFVFLSDSFQPTNNEKDRSGMNEPSDASDAVEFATETTYAPKTDAQWREILTGDQYYVTRRKGTERAGTSEFAYSKDDGIYKCVCCGLELFDSEDKFESGTGWPSYVRPYNEAHVETEADNTLFMRRTEVHCRRCGAHLGHVFPDGPAPTGLRYCINGVALSFEAEENN